MSGRSREDQSSSMRDTLARWRPAEAALWISAAAVFLLPCLALRSLEAPALLWGLVLTLFVTTLWRPAVGLAALVVGLPLSLPAERLVDYQLLSAAVVDLMVLVFAAATALRSVGGQEAPVSRLGAPAAVLAVAVVTSFVADVRALQAITPRHAVVPDIWHFIVDGYWTQVREFDVVRASVRWLSWLATAVAAERIVRKTPGPIHLPGVWLAAGLIGAALALHQVTVIALARPEPFLGAVGEFWTARRLSVFQPDVNAAGSRLLLFLVPAVVVGLRRRSWWLLAGAVPLLLAAFGLPRSRSAIVMGVATLCAAAGARWWQRRGAGAAAGRHHWLAAGALIVGGVVLGGTYLATARTHARVSDALQIRLDLLNAGLHAVARDPVFGAGLTGYIPATRRFVTDDMVLVRRMSESGENAHNNFLQIAVELGIPGCLLFIWLAARGVSGGIPLRPVASAWSEGMALGVVAFLGSALFGHPLLLPLVGASFFVALGVTAGLGGQASLRSWQVSLVWMAAGVYLGSLVWRW